MFTLYITVGLTSSSISHVNGRPNEKVRIDVMILFPSFLLTLPPSPSTTHHNKSYNTFSSCFLTSYESFLVDYQYSY